MKINDHELVITFRNEVSTYVSVSCEITYETNSVFKLGHKTKTVFMFKLLWTWSCIFKVKSVIVSQNTSVLEALKIVLIWNCLLVGISSRNWLCTCKKNTTHHCKSKTMRAREVGILHELVVSFLVGTEKVVWKITPILRVKTKKTKSLFLLFYQLLVLTNFKHIIFMGI